MIYFKFSLTTFFLFSLFVPSSFLQAATVEYHLTIAQEEVNFTGKTVSAMTINGAIPGPVLSFREGDLARIHVHNKMAVETSIHWHGLLVPPEMDGVPNISFPPIASGTTFTYEFPIRQNGTYWYHSHTNLQEQRGVYGAIVIEPQAPHIIADREHVVLLSDWTDENPHTVLRTLKRGSEWYSLEKGSGQSIFGAAKIGKVRDYFSRELQRMPPMDIADVAYDCFLANGQAESFLPASPGETVRLRIIDGSATTYFHLEFSGGPLNIIAADGQGVVPVAKERFLIAVAETYDVLVTIPEHGAYELRATAHDGSGYSSLWLGTGPRHYATNLPKPNLYQGMGHFNLADVFSLTPAGAMGMAEDKVKRGELDIPGMAGMAPMQGMKHGRHRPDSSLLDMGSHQSKADHLLQQQMPSSHQGHGVLQAPPAEMSDSQTALPERSGKRFGSTFHFLGTDISSAGDLAIDGMDPRRPLTPYKELRAFSKTTFHSDKPRREIRLTLDGDMERYIWTLNNKTLSEDDSIRIREGEEVRFIMINRTMMHHPMHLHGHFFRVINGQGAFAPLKHTVDVAPMTTTVIEFKANEVGDWFFHCHLLYHMKSGMARVVEYDTFTPDPAVMALRPKLYTDPWYFWGEADLLSHMSEGSLQASNTRHIISVQWEAGWQDVETNEWEGTLRWDYSLNRFTTLFIGQYLEGDEEDEFEKIRGIAGLTYLLPLSIESTLWIDNEGEARIDLGKSFTLTPRLSLYGELEYDTLKDWQGSSGLRYMVNKNLSLIGSYHSEFGFGAGLQLRF
ncbi:MAG: multicopper oxidase domain-containing protein [Proteobacteria bacterium]|nr:multicopper oxidase domain-containing protein [Pseudomonadota bacterium]